VVFFLVVGMAQLALAGHLARTAARCSPSSPLR
jgi:hypothetical protein